MTAKTAAEHKRDQREREAERLKRLGHRVMQLELYQGTADALDRLCQIEGFEQPAEVITLLIHSADQIVQRDQSRFAELVSVTSHAPSSHAEERAGPAMCAATTRRRPAKRRRKARNAPAEAPTTIPLPPLPHGKEACDKAQLSIF